MGVVKAPVCNSGLSVSHLREVFETRVATLIQFQPIRHGDDKPWLSLLGGMLVMGGYRQYEWGEGCIEIQAHSYPEANYLLPFYRVRVLYI